MLTLRETLTYRNPRIVNKFLMWFDVTETEAEDIFVETLKWLWLCAKAQKDRELGIPGVPKILNIQSGLVIIDEFWHVFIMHTRDYGQFCQKYLGVFVHHSPSAMEFLPATQSETEVQMAYIYDHLGGAQALKKWYQEYAARYAPGNIKLLRKDPLAYLDAVTA